VQVLVAVRIAAGRCTPMHQGLADLTIFIIARMHVALETLSKTSLSPRFEDGFRRPTTPCGREAGVFVRVFVVKRARRSTRIACCLTLMNPGGAALNIWPYPRTKDANMAGSHRLHVYRLCRPTLQSHSIITPAISIPAHLTFSHVALSPSTLLSRAFDFAALRYYTFASSCPKTPPSAYALLHYLLCKSPAGRWRWRICSSLGSRG